VLLKVIRHPVTKFLVIIKAFLRANSWLFRVKTT
jgi:hypothetical protein